MFHAPVTTIPRRRAVLAAAAAASVLLLAGCGGGDAQPEEPNSGAAQDAGSGGAHVDIVDNAFEPSEVDVTVGAAVEWENTGAATHTVTFDDGEASGNIESGGTYSRTFDEAGDYPYICSIHPDMTGTVTVAQ